MESILAMKKKMLLPLPQLFYCVGESRISEELCVLVVAMSLAVLPFVLFKINEIKMIYRKKNYCSKFQELMNCNSS